MSGRPAKVGCKAKHHVNYYEISSEGLYQDVSQTNEEMTPQTSEQVPETTLETPPLKTKVPKTKTPKSKEPKSKEPPKSRVTKKGAGKTTQSKSRPKKWTFDVLMHDPKSELGHADLQSKLNISRLQGFTEDELHELAAMLPICDRSYLTENGWIEECSIKKAQAYSESGTRMGLSSFALDQRNNVFWNNVRDWQNKLKDGEFSINNPKLKGAHNSVDSADNQANMEAPWKDDEFEAYWGERLERNEKLKRELE
ncbi:Asx homology domain-containing protein [Phycomyces blakesleeanus]